MIIFFPSNVAIGKKANLVPIDLAMHFLSDVNCTFIIHLHLSFELQNEDNFHVNLLL